MKIPGPLQQATFVSRPNRFTCLVRLPDQFDPVYAHLPDPGRLRELLLPGVRLWLEPKAGPRRKTAYQVWLVESGGTLVSLNTRLPNALVEEALARGGLPEFAGYTAWQRERRVGHSRLDFYLENAEEACWVEVKSVTLVENGRGLFPDAPTDRGRRHVEELIRLRKAGARAVVLFVAQRNDAVSVAANEGTDPGFAAVLHAAHGSGVEVIAYGCDITPSLAVLDRPLPVELG